MMHLFTKLIYPIQGGHCETSTYCFHIAVIKGVHACVGFIHGCVGFIHACVGFIHGCVGFVHGWPFIYSIPFLTVELLLWVIPFLTDFQISSNQYWFSYQRTQSSKLFISVSLNTVRMAFITTHLLYNNPPPNKNFSYIFFKMNKTNTHKIKPPTKLRLHMVTFTFLWGWC